MAGKGGSGTLPWQLIGHVATLSQKPCQRLHAKSKRDDLVLLHVKGRFHALESSCSHAGGPLYEGDIEDYKGRPHIMCPWHGYMFDVESGKNEMGIMQEVYRTKVEDEQVFVQYKCPLSTEPKKKK